MDNISKTLCEEIHICNPVKNRKPGGGESLLTRTGFFVCPCCVHTKGGLTANVSQLSVILCPKVSVNSAKKQQNGNWLVSFYVIL
jgi:hypothetical protein